MGLSDSDKIGEAYIEVKSDLRRLNADLIKVKNQSQKTTSKIGEGFAKLGNLIGGLAIFATVMIGLKKVIKSLRDLDSGMRNVNTIIRVGEKELKKYTKEVKRLASETGSTTKELTDGFYQLVSAGVAATDSVEFLGVAAKAAVAGLSDVKTAIDGMTTIMNSWQMSAKDSIKIFDILFKTVELGKTNFEEIASSISMVAPLAAAVGVSFEQVSGAIAQLTAQGTPTSVAMTQIAAAIIGMNKALGDGWTKTFTLQEAMEEMFKRAGGSAQKLQKLLGGRKEGVLAVLASAGKNAEAAGKKFEAMGNAAGSGMRAFNEQTKSFDFKLKKMGESVTQLISSFVIGFGTDVIKAINSVTFAIDVLSGRLAKQRRENVLGDVKAQASGWVEAFTGYDPATLKSELGIVTKQWTDLDSKLKKIVQSSKNIPLAGKLLSVGAVGEIEVKMRQLKAQAIAIDAILNKKSLFETPPPSEKIPPPAKDIIDAGEEDFTMDDFVISTEQLNKKLQDMETLLKDSNTDLRERLALLKEMDAIKTTLGIDVPDIEIEDINEDAEVAADAIVDAGSEFEGDMLNSLNAGQRLASTVQGGLFKAGQSLVDHLRDGFSIVMQALNIIEGFTPAGFIGNLLSGGGSGKQFGGSFTGGSRGIVKMKAGGSFTVPHGFGNDTFPMLVSSREKVQVTPASQAGNSDRLLTQLITSVEAMNMSMGDMKLNPTIINTFDADSLTENIIKPSENTFISSGVKVDQL